MVDQIIDRTTISKYYKVLPEICKRNREYF
jgi:hypothetical protein